MRRDVLNILLPADAEDREAIPAFLRIIDDAEESHRQQKKKES